MTIEITEEMQRILDGGAMPVHVTNPQDISHVLVTEEKEAEHFVCSSFPAVPGSIIQILQLDPLRKEATCTFSGLTSAGGTSTSAQGKTAVAPAAGTNIASIALPAGEYTIQWTAALSGTAAAGDADNFQLLQNAALVMQSENPAAVGTYVQETALVTIPAAGATIAVKVGPGAGTAAAVYEAQLTATPVNTALLNYGWVCHSEQQANDVSLRPTQANGAQVQAGMSETFKGTAPLWFVGAPGSSITVGVIAERRGN